jgi:hypothetical protein
MPRVGIGSSAKRRQRRSRRSRCPANSQTSPPPTPPAPPARASSPLRTPPAPRSGALRTELSTRPRRYGSAKPVAQALDAHSDQADARPGVEPAVQEPQLGRVGLDQDRRECRAEPAAAGVQSIAGGMVVLVCSTGHAGPAVAGDPDGRPIDARVQFTAQPVVGVSARFRSTASPELLERPDLHLAPLDGRRRRCSWRRRRTGGRTAPARTCCPGHAPSAPRSGPR